MIKCPATASAHAVRCAGKRLTENDPAEVQDSEFQWITGGLAPGMEAVMFFGGKSCRDRFGIPQRCALCGMEADAAAKKHLSGQPDGAAAWEGMTVCGCKGE